MLNHHKRMHTQEQNENQNEAITVVTSSQNLVQAQNLVNENGQSLGQIQIVATESLEPAQQQQIQQQTQEITISSAKTVSVDKTQKCITCGGPILLNPKRKGPKLIRCESCINNDNQTHIATSRATATQIFVAPDGDVKFELGEIPNTSNSESSIDSLAGQNIIQITNTGNTIQQQNQQIQQKCAPGHHPVKKRNTAAFTKCHKCNGSGVVLIGGQKKQQQQQLVLNFFYLIFKKIYFFFFSF